MAFTPISNDFIQYQATASGTSAAAYFLKLYAAGTTTPISAALDSAGSVLVAKVELDSEGFAKNASGGPTTVYTDQTYRLVLYVNSTDADNNTFANAVQDIDNIPKVLTSTVGGITDLLFKTVADMKLGITVEGSIFTLSAGLTLTTQGYYTAGDGGGGTYFVEAGTTSLLFMEHNLTGGTHAVLQSRTWWWAQSLGLNSTNIGDIAEELKAQLSRNAKLELPSGLFQTDKTITCDIRGTNQTIGFTSGNSTIQQTDLTKSVWEFQHDGQTLEDVVLDYDVSGLNGVFVPTMIGLATKDVTVTGGTANGAKISRIGIQHCYYATWLSWSIFGSAIDQIEIRHCYIGLFTPPGASEQTSLAIGMVKIARTFRPVDITEWVYCSIGLYADFCGLNSTIDASNPGEIDPPSTMTPVLFTAESCKGFEITTFGIENSPAMLFDVNLFSKINVSSLHYSITSTDFWVRDAVRIDEVVFAEQGFIRLASSDLSISSTEMIWRTAAGFPTPSTTDTDFLHYKQGTDASHFTIDNSFLDIGSYYWSRQVNTVTDYDAFLGLITDKFFHNDSRVPKGVYLTKDSVERYVNLINATKALSLKDREGNDSFKIYKKFTGAGNTLTIPFTAFNQADHPYFLRVEGINTGGSNVKMFLATIQGEHGVSGTTIVNEVGITGFNPTTVSGDNLILHQASGYAFDDLEIEIKVMTGEPYFITDGGGNQNIGFDLKEQFFIDMANITATTV